MKLLRSLRRQILLLLTIGCFLSSAATWSYLFRVKLLVHALRFDSLFFPATRALKSEKDVAIPILISTLSDRDSWQSGVDALQQFGADAVPALVDCIKDPKSPHRRSAVWIISTIGPPAKDAVPALVGVLTHPSPDIRSDVLWAINRIGHAACTAAPSLVAIMFNDPNESVRRDAVIAIGELGPGASQAAPALNLVANHAEDVLLRSYAVQSLGQVEAGCQHVRPVIHAALVSEISFAREHAIVALGELKYVSRSEFNSIQSALSDKSQGVRSAATRALKRIIVDE